MGFRPEPRRYSLTFIDDDLEGLEVLAGSVSVREYNEMVRIQLNAGGLTEESIKNGDRVLEMFAEALVEWNLEDQEGKPVPATREGIESQDSSLIVRLISAWQRALVTVPPTSQRTPSNGEPPPELDLAALSAALPS